MSITGDPNRLLGRSVDELVDASWHDLILDVDRFEATIASLPEHGGEGTVANLDLRHRNGHTVPFRHRVRRDPASGNIQGAAIEISELAMATRLIRHHADHDDLTGLVTRNVFLARLDELIGECSEVEPLAVLLVDLDRFKDVNEVLGHRVGDRLLALLARRFDQLPFVDSVARLGGDEFAFALGGAGAEQAARRARDVVATIEELIQVDRLKLSVSGTVGVAVAACDSLDARSLMMRADMAMCRAKTQGRRVAVYDDGDDGLAGERIALGSELEAAIAAGQIEVWFQPKVDLATERVVGAEGLARWRHPDLGLLTPNRFLPLLSVSGAYQVFTDEVLRQGIEFAARSRAEAAPLSVAVNLNAVSFFDHGLADRVRSMLDFADVDPSQLTLEITESDILADLSVHGPVFERLTSLGVDLSIDDFGVGYSSLSRLRRLPVQELKIDRSFVARLEEDPEDLIIVKAVVDLANVLGHRSVAEGVETIETRDRLRDLGCEHAQGYLFGRPVPPDEFLATFRAADGVRRMALDGITG